MSPVIPVSIVSMANIDVSPPAEIVEPPVELSVDMPVDNVKEFIKKF